MTAGSNYETIGRILRTKPDKVEALVETIVDLNAETGVRCAALDRYVQIRKAGGFALLTDIVEDFGQPEELRAHCQHWLLDPRIETGKVETRAAVKTKAAVRTSGKAARANMKTSDPSERLRWLKSL